MARRYRRRSRRAVKTAKYSSENYNALVQLNNVGATGTTSTWVGSVVPATSVLSTRKAKNFTLRIAPDETLVRTNTGTTEDPNIEESFDKGFIAWALVYLPEGTNPNRFNFGDANGAVSLYEPNQNVIMCGIASSDQVYSYKTKLARNLSAGDSIVLIVNDLHSKEADETQVVTPFAFTLNYAIAF